MVGRVYKLINDVDDKIYVGSTTKSLNKRIAGHRATAKTDTDRLVYKHLNAIGWVNVHIELLEECPLDVRTQREQHYIDELKAELNSRGSTTECIHGTKKRWLCVACGGASMCSHGIKRAVCAPCGGVSICRHGRQIHRCVECKGAGVCEHGAVKYRCKRCGGKDVSTERCGCGSNIQRRSKAKHLKSPKHKRWVAQHTAWFTAAAAVAASR